MRVSSEVCFLMGLGQKMMPGSVVNHQAGERVQEMHEHRAAAADDQRYMPLGHNAHNRQPMEATWVIILLRFSMIFCGFGEPVGSRFLASFLFFSWFEVINFEGQF